MKHLLYKADTYIVHVLIDIIMSHAMKTIWQLQFY